MKRILFISLVVLSVLLSGAYVAYAAMQKTVTIVFSDGRPKIVSVGLHNTLSEALENEGQNVAELKASYVPSIPWEQPLENHAKVLLSCKCKVKLVVGGKDMGTFTTTQTTVAAFLKERKIELNVWDEPNVSLNQKIKNGMTIVIDKVQQRVKREVKEIPFETKEEKDNQLPYGEKKVVKEGKKGKEIYQVTYLLRNDKPIIKDGKPAVTKVLVETIKPVTQVVKIGTNKELAKKKEEEDASGLKRGEPMIFESTAYTAGPNSRTATGTRPKRGTVAVDPRVIPLGTRLYIEGYGYGIAEDTGGRIKGRIIDVFFETEEECIAWGRRHVKVYILK